MPLFAKLGLLLTLSAIFLRMGSVTFGGGLVMLPLIESEVVNTHHWLTHQEFADAAALGQITPGPARDDGRNPTNRHFFSQTGGQLKSDLRRVAA
jgi:chromate transporter